MPTLYTKLTKPKNSLRTIEKTLYLVNLLQEELKNIDWTKNKINIDVIERICNLVECEFQKKKRSDEKVDKKLKVLEIIGSFISLSEEDKRVIGDIIDHLHNTGRIKLPSTKRLLKTVGKYFLTHNSKQ